MADSWNGLSYCASTTRTRTAPSLTTGSAHPYFSHGLQAPVAASAAHASALWCPPLKGDSSRSARSSSSRRIICVTICGSVSARSCCSSGSVSMLYRHGRSAQGMPLAGGGGPGAGGPGGGAGPTWLLHQCFGSLGPQPALVREALNACAHWLQVLLRDPAQPCPRQQQLPAQQRMVRLASHHELL